MPTQINENPFLEVPVIETERSTLEPSWGQWENPFCPLTSLLKVSCSSMKHNKRSKGYQCSETMPPQIHENPFLEGPVVETEKLTLEPS